MSGISGISPIYSGMTGQSLPAADTSGQQLEAGQAGASVGSSSILSLSSTSMSASSETLMASGTPMLASNEALGAALLLLVLQYLQSGDSQEKQGLSEMIVGLAGMAQQGQGGGDFLLYSSSSLSIESTQLSIATSQGIDAYTGAAASLQQAPSADAGAAGLDVTA